MQSIIVVAHDSIRQVEGPRILPAEDTSSGFAIFFPTASFLSLFSHPFRTLRLGAYPLILSLAFTRLLPGLLTQFRESTDQLLYPSSPSHLSYSPLPLVLSYCC
jgi:hypothetical protein